MLLPFDSKGIAVYIRTKGFIAYEGGPTEWSASVNTHPGTATTLTTQFSGITVNNGGIETDHHLNAGITVNGNYWGAYDLMQIKSGSQTNYYAVCHSDSNSNYCGSTNWQYMTNFAMDHI